MLLKKLLEGYRRKSKTKDIRLPIKSNISEKENSLKGLPVVCTDNYERRLFAAALVWPSFG